MSLYDQLGQGPGISTAVAAFYERVLADPSLQPYFAGSDVDRVKAHQVALLSTVTGGPATYGGRTLAAAHGRLGVTGPHFDRVVQHLGDTPDELGVDADVRDQVAAVLVAQREHVVSVPAPAAVS